VNDVRTAAERLMWIEWASSCNEQYWREINEDSYGATGNVMKLWDPVLERLIELHVPLAEVSSMQRVGDGFFNQGMRVLDMVKFTKWAQRNKPPIRLNARELAAMHELLNPTFRVRDQLRCSRTN
jgi:hypothetical protein